MLCYIIIIGILGLGHSTLGAEDPLDNLEIENLSITVLDEECNKDYEFEIKDFALQDDSNIHSLFKGMRGEYLFCVSKKYGLTKDDGTFNVNGLKPEVTFLNQEVRDIVQNCSDRKGNSPIQTFRLSNVCAMNKVMEYRAGIANRYYYYIISEEPFKNKRLFNIVAKCANQTGATPFEVIEKSNTCVLTKLQRYETKVENLDKMLHPSDGDEKKYKYDYEIITQEPPQ